MHSGLDSSGFEERLASANELIYQAPREARTQLNALLDSLPDSCVELRARVTERLSIVERILGNFELATRLGETAVEGYERCQNQVGVTRAWVSLGNIHWSRGETDSALNYYQKAYTQRAKSDDHAATAGALASVANIHVEMGRLNEARDEYEKVLDLAHRAQNKRIIARTENNLSECLLELGNTGTALNHARNALAMCRKIGDRSEEPNVLINLGRILGKLRFGAEALENLELAVRTAASVGDRRAHAESQKLWAKQIRAQPDYAGPASADELEDQAYTEAKEIGALGLRRAVCIQAIQAAEHAQDTARVRRYQKRLAAIPSS